MCTATASLPPCACRARARVAVGARSRRARSAPRSPSSSSWATGSRASPSRWSGWRRPASTWKPVFFVLERRFECWLINAEHLHNVPGRKSDVIDSRWLCELLELGLVRPSFVPPPEIRRLRDLTRLRSTQAEERTRAIQRLEKVLQDAGIKLTSVAAGTYSVSARAMLEALLGGVSDPACLAELAKGRLRAKIPQLQEAL